MTEGTMQRGAAAAAPTLRVSVVGDERRVDVVVPLWTGVGELAEVYMNETGARGMALLTVAGRPLEAGTTLHDAGLRDGSLLIAVRQPGRRARVAPAPTSALAEELSGSESTASGPGRRARRAEEPDAETAPAGAAWPVLPMSTGPAAVAIGSVGIAVTAALAGADARTWAPIALVLLGLLTAILARGTKANDALWLSTVPIHAAGAAVLVLPAGAPVLLIVGVGALVAAAVAATMRTATPGVADDELITWTIGGGLVAVIAAVCLLADWSAQTFFTVIIAAAIIGTRAIPSYAVRVPDHVLLDTDRLAVTAWTAREQRRRSFRGVVRRGDVSSVAHRGTELVAVGTVACSVAVVVATAALLLADLSQTRRIGVLLLCLGAGGVLVLSGRNRRDRAARRLQRTVGTVTVLATSAWWVLDLGQTWQVRLIVASIVVAALCLVASRAVSRGWTSLWWARRAEVAETLAGILVFGSIPLATGLFEWMRVLTSP